MRTANWPGSSSSALSDARVAASSLRRRLRSSIIALLQQFLSQALNGEYIGLEEVDDGLWNILYYDTLLGRYEQRTKAITGAPAIRAKC